MRIIIDRLEGEVAVAEIDANGTMLRVPRALFPDAKEGDTVEITVLGKMPLEDSEPPHEIFERLRKKSRSKNEPQPKKRKKAKIEPAPHTAEAVKKADNGAVAEAKTDQNPC